HVVAAAAGCAHPARVAVEPPAPAKHAEGSLDLKWIHRRRGHVIHLRVLYPLPDVARHIVATLGWGAFPVALHGPRRLRSVVALVHHGPRLPQPLTHVAALASARVEQRRAGR